MMKRVFLTVLGAVVVGLTLCADVLPKKTFMPQPYYGEIAQKVARMLPAAHLLQHPLNDEMSQKAWTNLIESLDADHSYFLRSDIESFTNMEFQIDDAVKAGDVSFPYEVYRVFCERVEDRYVFVTNLLQKGFAFTENETYSWKRKDVPWPATPAERDEIWRKRIKNEYLMQVISRELEMESASNVVQKAAVTNPVPVAAGASVTNAPVLTPKDNIATRYKQYMIVIQDMDEEAVLQRYLSSIAMAYDPRGAQKGGAP